MIRKNISPLATGFAAIALAIGGAACDDKSEPKDAVCESLACVEAADCPAPANVCVQRSCESGCCGTTFVNAGVAPAAGQTDGDCRQVVCDGNGATSTVDDPTDTPAPEDDCHVGVCEDGNPTQEAKAARSACGPDDDKICTAEGACVECTGDQDCAAPLVCAPSTHECVPATCVDGRKNGRETDTDCGGGADDGETACPKCDFGKACAESSDCETDLCLDGLCARKDVGQACDADAQCGSGHCIDQVCCDSACDGTCEACALPGSVGSCTAVPDGTDPGDECEDQGAQSCGTTGVCNGARACATYATGTICRDAAGVCDVAEACPGDGEACPFDAFVAADTVCRPHADVCDLAESCTGFTADCPADGYLWYAGSDPGFCDGGLLCDGQGIGADHCRTTDGSPGSLCGNGTNCLSGVCVDLACN